MKGVKSGNSNCDIPADIGTWILNFLENRISYEIEVVGENFFKENTNTCNQVRSHGYDPFYLTDEQEK